MPEYAEGEILGYVVVTWGALDPFPDIDTPGLHNERETAVLERDSRRERTRQLGRRERHEVAAVIEIEEGEDGPPAPPAHRG